MKLIVLNSNHFVTGSNNKFLFNFPNNPRFQEGDQIAVLGFAMYNSIFNVTSSLNNNTFQIVLNFATPVTMTLTLPDGFYSVDDMQYYIEQQMLLGKYYVTNTSGENVFFFHIAENSVYYTVNVICDLIPTSAQATTLGYTQASGATWSYPTTEATSQLIVLSTNSFGSLIGYDAGTIGTATTATEMFNSDNTPNIQPVNSLMLRCNMVSSAYSIPVDVIYSKSIDTSFGGLIKETVNYPIWQDIIPQSFSQCHITITDQTFNNILINDVYGSVITLAIRSKNER